MPKALWWSNPRAALAVAAAILVGAASAGYDRLDVQQSVFITDDLARTLAVLEAASDVASAKSALMALPLLLAAFGLGWLAGRHATAELKARS